MAACGIADSAYGVASMGPRLDGRGWSTSGLPRSPARELQWGRAWMGADGTRANAGHKAVVPLQWGRAWMGADGNRCLMPDWT